MKETVPVITLAETDLVDIYEKEIREIVNYLGHPEALVTDESRFFDFVCSGEFPTAELSIEELNRRLPFKVINNMRLVDYAIELRSFKLKQ